MLLQQIAEGDKAAFKVIHDHYCQAMYNTCIRFLKSPSDAMDITQDVFLKLWVARATLPAITNFKAYLFITTRNELVAALRKRLRLHAFNDSYLPAEYTENLSEDALLLKQLEHLIHEGVAQLPPQQQLVYDLTRNHGLSHDEIAGRLGIAKKTVSNIITRALTGLRRYLVDRGDLST